MPVKNFKIMKVPGHHFTIPNITALKKHLTEAKKKKNLPAYKLNTILFCILKLHF